MKRDIAKSRIVLGLLLGSFSSELLFVIGYVFYHDSQLAFLNWNLFLAWLPLLFGYLLSRSLKTRAWSSWQPIVYSALWLGFLPNSFYIATDFIHMRLANSSTSLFYVVLILSFTLNGFFLGYTALFMLHKQLQKRLSWQRSHLVIAAILLACSYAIYLGRYLRWNTWDVLINPAGILYNASDPFINPAAHEQTFRITILFFVLLGTTYAVIWQFVQAIQQPHKS